MNIHKFRVRRLQIKIAGLRSARAQLVNVVNTLGAITPHQTMLIVELARKIGEIEMRLIHMTGE